MPKSQAGVSAIARSLRKARIDSELTVRGLANLIGISHTHLLRIEKGERSLTSEIAAKHARAIAGVANRKSA